MNSTKKTLAIGIFIGVIVTALAGVGIVVVGGLTGYIINKEATETETTKITSLHDSFELGRSESLLNDTVSEKMDYLTSLIDYYYMEDADKDAMIEGMYKGVTEALEDPYSVYYDEEETEALTETIDGSYSGIGATLSQNAETMALTVIRMFEGTPAVEAGLVPGDIIVSVDGTDITGMDISAAVALIKGEEGTTVELEIYREGETDYLKVPVTRRKIDIPTVAHDMLEDDIGYIQISTFDKGTVEQFEKAYTDLQSQNMEGLVIDLRSNPGGTLDSVCEIAEYFVPEGLIVYMEDKYGKKTEYLAEGKDTFGKPLVVLVDGNSASASEIFAGAVQDTKVGTIVGTQTYGKGVVQQVIDLGDGTAVKLTISKYFTPNGNDIHKKGITPDVVEELNEELYQQAVITFEEDNQMKKALETLKSQMNK